MKKFLIVCFVIFVASVGCKKENIGGGGACGCSPVVGPQLMLVVKNSAGEDLLNSNTAGSFSKDNIKLFSKDANGKETQLYFNVRPPFNYTPTESFTSNTLYSVGFSQLWAANKGTIYLKLGDAPAYELNVEIDNNKSKVEKVVINNKEAEKDKGAVAKYANIFYLVK